MVNERLTADGYEPDVDPCGRLVKGIPFIHLYKAQAIADERDAALHAKETAREHWQECQNRLTQIEQRLIAITDHECGIDDNITALVSERDEARLRAKGNELLLGRASSALHLVLSEATGCSPCEWDTYAETAQRCIVAIRSIRQCAEQAEARVERYRTALVLLRSEVTASTTADAVEAADEALACEPQPPKSAPCASDCVFMPCGGAPHVCQKCDRPIDHHRCCTVGVDMAEPYPAPPALDPALREPMLPVPCACELDGTVVVTFDAYLELKKDANARIAALVAAYDALAERYARAVRIAGDWRRMSQRTDAKLAGEPERTKAAVAAATEELVQEIELLRCGSGTRGYAGDPPDDELAPPTAQGQEVPQ